MASRAVNKRTLLWSRTTPIANPYGTSFSRAMATTTTDPSLWQGAKDVAAGKVKEVAGKVMGNNDLEQRGREQKEGGSEEFNMARSQTDWPADNKYDRTKDTQNFTATGSTISDSFQDSTSGKKWQEKDQDWTNIRSETRPTTGSNIRENVKDWTKVQTEGQTAAPDWNKSKEGKSSFSGSDYKQDQKLGGMSSERKDFGKDYKAGYSRQDQKQDQKLGGMSSESKDFGKDYNKDYNKEASKTSDIDSKDYYKDYSKDASKTSNKDYNKDYSKDYSKEASKTSDKDYNKDAVKTWEKEYAKEQDFGGDKSRYSRPMGFSGDASKAGDYNKPTDWRQSELRTDDPRTPNLGKQGDQHFHMDTSDVQKAGNYKTQNFDEKSKVYGATSDLHSSGDYAKHTQYGNRDEEWKPPDYNRNTSGYGNERNMTGDFSSKAADFNRKHSDLKGDISKEGDFNSDYKKSTGYSQKDKDINRESDLNLGANKQKQQQGYSSPSFTDRKKKDKPVDDRDYSNEEYHQSTNQLFNKQSQDWHVRMMEADKASAASKSTSHEQPSKQ